LARACSRNETDAVDKVKECLAGIGLELDHILNRAQARKAKELVQGYVRREPGAVKLIDRLLARASKSIEAFTADASVHELDNLERIDRLATIAESRRNASLREIDRRRAALGETLRRSLQQVEADEFKVIEVTPAKGKSAA
jgi:hypothetical protein